MKKTTSLLACLFLSACNIPEEPKITRADFMKLDTAPLEYIHIVPSKRAIEYKEVDFARLDRKIRRNLHDEGIDKFNNITMIMVDYTELPAKEANQFMQQYPCNDPKYYADYDAKPARYYLNLKFYTCNKKPPSAPDSDITVTLSKEKAYPFGAFVTMVYEAVRDYATYNKDKITIDIDY